MGGVGVVQRLLVDVAVDEVKLVKLPSDRRNGLAEFKVT